MRTKIELDDDLVRVAKALSGLSTTRAVVHQALREFVARRKRIDLRDLEGSDLLDPDYDYKALRAAGASAR